MRNQELPVPQFGERIQLRNAPWSVRLGQAVSGRAALEVYVDGALVDVVVPTPMVSGTLRGACSSKGADRRWLTLAWGVFEGSQIAPPVVLFRRRRICGTVYRSGHTFSFGRRFWLSAADGRYTSVAATRSDGETEGHEIRALRSSAFPRRIGSR
ncbi:hypothetical protein OG496_41070 [Streptomyces sp. NBC_00988]|uniref:hypothetical protein n=1 Tax=Streptomyces sp. NBC_00988 TaxID=2903704 RepID=UPI00386672B8|nr:hypothetical protein OG496_41070 [Streptomyces sp. NBC_00988]